MSTHELLRSVVEPRAGGPGAADHLLRQPRRLSGDRVAELGARGDVAQSTLRLVAREHSVRELECPGAPERSGHEALQFAARGELGNDALEHAVADERARELLRERPGERSVDHAGDLGCREDLVQRLLDRSSPCTRGRSRRKERGAPGRARQTRAVLVVLRRHQLPS